MKQKRTGMVIGAGLIGAQYVKQALSEGMDTVATVKSLEREKDLFERRLFPKGAKAEEISLQGRTALRYETPTGKVTLTELDVFEGDVKGTLSAVEGVDHVINAINLGTILGLRGLQEGGLPETAAFDLCFNYHTALDSYARERGITLPHLLVSTTGSGGIGLERMRISHNLAGTGIPPSIILKSRYASEVLSALRDFRRSGDGAVIHKAIVPACAVVDLQIHEGDVQCYGDYRKLAGREMMPATFPRVEIDGKVTTERRELGNLHAVYGLFGEDGPHTIADLQQLQMFMGVTTAAKVAQIMADTVVGRGAYNYDVLAGGNNIPEQSEYAVFSFERTARRTLQRVNSPITLSPIAPFDIALRCHAYELLADAGLEYLHQFQDCAVDDGTLKSIAERSQQVLLAREPLLVSSTSLGITYNLEGSVHSLKTEGAFTRGTLANDTLRAAITNAQEFVALRDNSQKLDDFLKAYEHAGGIPTKDVIGYLAAFPIASQMRKQGHF